MFAPKIPRWTGLAISAFKLFAEFFIELVCLLGSRCMKEGGPVAFSRAGKERELADDQEIACNVLHGKVHRTIFIRENAKPGDLAGQPENVLPRIRGFDTKEHQQPATDLTDDLLLHLHRGACDALDNCAHGER